RSPASPSSSAHRPPDASSFATYVAKLALRTRSRRRVTQEPEHSPGSDPDPDHPVVVRAGGAAPVAVRRGDPQRPVGGPLDGAHPAEATTQEPRPAPAAAAVELRRPQRPPAQRPDVRPPLGHRESAGGALGGGPHGERVAVAATPPLDDRPAVVAA